METRPRRGLPGRLRRYYRLTQPGSCALAAEAECQAAYARVAARRLRARRAADAGNPT
jgi:PadR family transcriptional regulator PadR